MLDFLKKSKKSEEPIKVDTDLEVNDNREDALSLWFDNINAAKKTMTAKAENTDTSFIGRKREGYIFCRKCYKIHSAKELVCPACGTPSKKNN